MVNAQKGAVDIVISISGNDKTMIKRLNGDTTTAEFIDMGAPGVMYTRQGKLAYYRNCSAVESDDGMIYYAMMADTHIYAFDGQNTQSYQAGGSSTYHFLAGDFLYCMNDSNDYVCRLNTKTGERDSLFHSGSAGDRAVPDYTIWVQDGYLYFYDAYSSDKFYVKYDLRTETSEEIPYEELPEFIRNVREVANASLAPMGEWEYYTTSQNLSVYRQQDDGKLREPLYKAEKDAFFYMLAAITNEHMIIYKCNGGNTGGGNLAPQTCVICHGAGSITCSTCHGVGLTIQGQVGLGGGVGYAPCKVCGGAGQKTCTACGGTGLVYPHL